ncbi:unnamed protein product [Allacma fusca]|uniref:Uncharacterized protein n=1 Tax=Allacma fusca TaxID=39272 RepID=A0A8J2NZF3_9HEXA|nr:unnamed protein product [Allacma fusca]
MDLSLRKYLQVVVDLGQEERSLYRKRKSTNDKGWLDVIERPRGNRSINPCPLPPQLGSSIPLTTGALSPSQI